MRITKNDISDMLGNFGCFGIILILMAFFLMIVPGVIFVAATMLGFLAYLGWNLALAPILGVAPIVMWWQAFGIGILLIIFSWLLRGVISLLRA